MSKNVMNELKLKAVGHEKLKKDYHELLDSNIKLEHDFDILKTALTKQCDACVLQGTDTCTTCNFYASAVKFVWSEA
jgi:hypothetical protein